MIQSQFFTPSQMQQAILEAQVAQMRTQMGPFGFLPGFSVASTIVCYPPPPPQPAPPANAIEHDPAADAARTRALRQTVPAEQP